MNNSDFVGEVDADFDSTFIAYDKVSSINRAYEDDPLKINKVEKCITKMDLKKIFSGRINSHSYVIKVTNEVPLTFIMMSYDKYMTYFVDLSYPIVVHIHILSWFYI